MLIATEGAVVTVLVVVVAKSLIVVAKVRVVLHPMRYGSWHMRPLVQVQYAEGVKGEGEGEETTHRGNKVGPVRSFCKTNAATASHSLEGLQVVMGKVNGCVERR